MNDLDMVAVVLTRKLLSQAAAAAAGYLAAVALGHVGEVHFGVPVACSTVAVDPLRLLLSGCLL